MKVSKEDMNDDWKDDGPGSDNNDDGDNDDKGSSAPAQRTPATILRLPISAFSHLSRNNACTSSDGDAMGSFNDNILASARRHPLLAKKRFNGLVFEREWRNMMAVKNIARTDKHDNASG